MTTYNIGIVDDDSSKITQIMTRLQFGCENASQEKKDKYAQYTLNPIEINLVNSIPNMINDIIDKHIDCLLIDYKFSSYAIINFSGIDLAKAIYENLYEFPIFILTSYEDDLFIKELFNAYQVFDFDRYINESSERVELNFKIIEQINKYKKECEEWERELLSLLPKSGESPDIDERILDLDSKLEKRINGKSSLPASTKKDLSTGRVDSLITKLNEILERD